MLQLIWQQGYTWLAVVYVEFFGVDKLWWRFLQDRPEDRNYRYLHDVIATVGYPPFIVNIGDVAHGVSFLDDDPELVMLLLNNPHLSRHEIGRAYNYKARQKRSAWREGNYQILRLLAARLRV